MNPYMKSNHAYKKAAVTTLDQGSLILMLYDGAVKYLTIANAKIAQKDREGSHNAIVKAKTIISELMGSLNLEASGELGDNLSRLYHYMYDRLIDANVEMDQETIKEVVSLLMELREGWRSIIQQESNAAAKTVAPRPAVRQQTGMKKLSIQG